MRGALAVLIIPKPFRLVAVSEDASEAGLPKEGVFVRLKASTPSFNLNLSLNAKVRSTPRLAEKNPGPRTEFLPAFPNAAVVTEAKAFGSKYGCKLS